MKNVSLRDVPDELYQQIKEIAERDRRSSNQQILVLLEQAVRPQKRPKTDVLINKIFRDFRKRLSFL